MEENQNKVLSPWEYFGYKLLFAIPFIGFVMLIVLSFAPKNKVLKNFARSYWCDFLIFLGIIAILLLAVFITGNWDAFVSALQVQLASVGIVF